MSKHLNKRPNPTQSNQIKCNISLFRPFLLILNTPNKGTPQWIPEKGGRKPAPSPQTSSYSPVWSRLEAQTICSTCFATLRPPFLNIIFSSPCKLSCSEPQRTLLSVELRSSSIFLHFPPAFHGFSFIFFRFFSNLIYILPFLHFPPLFPLRNRP